MSTEERHGLCRFCHAFCSMKVHLEDGRIVPALDGPMIRKRLVDDLDGAKFPTNYIVPFTQQVHDRIALEVLRGCTQGCRFCQPGMVTRPVRERSLKNVDKLMEDTIANTGYEEVSLLSLSTCDMSRPRKLVKQAADRANEDGVSVSLPSLRLDSFSVELADMVAGVRRSGLTFAPEAASPRLRAVINKWIPDEELLKMSYEAFQRKWDHVKCYFMIGLPTERDEDVQAIVDLCIRVLWLGKTVNERARVNLGVSTFVPKPFTPFQWSRQISMEETLQKQNILQEGFKKHPAIKFGRHNPALTWFEGLLSRADRRAADLIECAWRKGARFESWDEYFNLDAWQSAIEETKFDVDYCFRERGLEERLPWDHIDILIDKEWLKQDWLDATELKHAQDCRAGKCHLCGVINKERDLCVHMLKRQKEGRKEADAPAEDEATGAESGLADAGAGGTRLKPRPRPAITQGMTEKIRTGDGSLYITINEDANGLCEVFASLGKAGGAAAAQSEAMCRLISLCLRSGIDPEAIVRQLKGIAGPNPVWDNGELILSAPDAIGRALERYLERRGEGTGGESLGIATRTRGTARAEDVVKAAGESETFQGPGAMPARPMASCPDCGSPVAHENACLVCKHCGWSKC